MIRTAFVSTYPPQACGVATFTYNLAAAVGGREIVAIQPAVPATPVPFEVHHRIQRDDAGDYPRTAEALRSCADVVSVQYETGLWGGPDGSSVIDFVDALRMPAVATLHRLPGSPTSGERAVIAELLQRVARTVAMSPAAARLAQSEYGLDPSRMEIIPHGIPDLPQVDPETVKPLVGMAGRDVLLGFGLLHPGKGWERVLEALPAIVSARPHTTLVLVGVTPQQDLERDGEHYRASLVALVDRLHLGDHVTFVDRFVGRVELTRWLEAADVVLAPYTNLNQSVAGTVSYAMGAGRPVVATPFAVATDLLADGRGVLVQPASTGAYAEAVVALLQDPETRAAIGHRAHEHSRSMTWWHVAARYRELLGQVVSGATAGRPVVRPFALPA
jgi:glycosyltransferase involved in cell wall biosynthesis